MKYDNTIGIRYFSSLSDNDLLNECEKVLDSNGIKLIKSDLEGQILNLPIYFSDLEVIIFNYTLLQGFIVAGTYDIFKLLIVKLWSTIKTISTKTPLFSIRISGINYKCNKKDVSCKVQGDISDEQKNMVIEKMFNLVQSISDNKKELIEQEKYNILINKYIFIFNNDNNEFEQLDIDKELQKKTDK